MQGLAALLFPPVLMLFALAMERVQNGLDRLSVGRAHVEEFLETADETDVGNLAKDGMPAALDELRLRRDNDLCGDPVLPIEPESRTRAS
ncbi:hypothetical protein nbrc107696_19200 [Gordonia spumicola]|uniref:Uncharacterized protein n=1 Tax=Gordonia spumicola TaxID=589161 RepID=A0A7I9V8B5_9ACTN|nr:hypothetical protein [Gordonia spumicola]GEE01474.1 hypothetical protein nbrc107696_19200 [Gordonia spumicola]